MTPRWGVEATITMRLIIEVKCGPLAGQRRVVQTDELWVGRSTRADLKVDGDEQLAVKHFALVREGEAHWLRTREGSPTLLNGEEASDTELRHCDWIRAGDTDFIVYREGALYLPDAAEVIAQSPARTTALQALQALPSRRYAVLDAARERHIWLLLMCVPERWQSLYEGADATKLAAACPYLVELGDAEQGGLAEQLIAQGWGNSWGIFLSSSRPFAAVRRHLRKLLKVTIEGETNRAYFRFYDPRVLRDFLPLATVKQRTSIFDEIDPILLEDEAGEVRVYQRSDPAV